MIKGLYRKQCLCSIITMDRHKLSQLHSVTFTGQYNERKDNMFHLSCGNSLLTIVFELTGLSGARHPLLFPHQPDSGSKQPFRNSITHPAMHPDFFSHSKLSQPRRCLRRVNRALLKDHSPEIPCRCATNLLRNTTEPTGGSDRGEAKVMLKYPLLKK